MDFYIKQRIRFLPMEKKEQAELMNMKQMCLKHLEAQGHFDANFHSEDMRKLSYLFFHFRFVF